MSSDSSSSTSSNSPYENHRGRKRLLEEPSSSTASFKRREPKKRHEFGRLTTSISTRPEKKSSTIEGQSQRFEPQPSTSYASNNRQYTISNPERSKSLEKSKRKHKKLSKSSRNSGVKAAYFSHPIRERDRLIKLRLLKNNLRDYSRSSSSLESITTSRRAFSSSSSSSTTDLDRIQNKHRNKSSLPPRPRHRRSKSLEKSKKKHNVTYFSDPKREIERRMRLMENNSRVYRRSRSPIHRRRRSPERCRHPSHSAYLEYPNYSMQPSTHFIYYTSPPWNPSMMHPVPFNRPPFIPPYVDYLMRPHPNYGPRMPIAVPRMRYRYPGPPRYPGSYLFNRPRQNF